MTRSVASVPHVPARPRRRLGPRPALSAPTALAPLADALLARQHAERRSRAEARSLSPPFLKEVDRRLATERAIEENLARGRALTRHEVRRATDPGRRGREWVRFPRAFCAPCEILRSMGLGLAALLLPFLAYFGLVALIVL